MIAMNGTFFHASAMISRPTTSTSRKPGGVRQRQVQLVRV